MATYTLKLTVSLASTNTLDRCVVEIKIANKLSIKKLENAIRIQLVEQYLRHLNCTAGFLLVIYSGGKGFKGPDKKSMSFEHVIEQLKQYATSLEKDENGRIKLGIFSVDLRNIQT